MEIYSINTEVEFASSKEGLEELVKIPINESSRGSSIETELMYDFFSSQMTTHYNIIAMYVKQGKEGNEYFMLKSQVERIVTTLEAVCRYSKKFDDKWYKASKTILDKYKPLLG